jgi:hypothetical protein
LNVRFFPLLLLCLLPCAGCAFSGADNAKTSLSYESPRTVNDAATCLRAEAARINDAKVGRTLAGFYSNEAGTAYEVDVSSLDMVPTTIFYIVGAGASGAHIEASWRDDRPGARETVAAVTARCL